MLREINKAEKLVADRKAIYSACGMAGMNSFMDRRFMDKLTLAQLHLRDLRALDNRLIMLGAYYA